MVINGLFSAKAEYFLELLQGRTMKESIGQFPWYFFNSGMVFLCGYRTATFDVGEAAHYLPNPAKFTSTIKPEKKGT
jgi:hypothetical protein